MMQLRTVNVGQPREIMLNGRATMTSIYKESVAGPVMVRRLGLDGDTQSNLKYHGGVDQAVYLYPQEHYAYWAAHTGHADMLPGHFGENFTTVGLLEDAVHSGDTFRIGSQVVVQAVQPRIPCSKLEHKMGIAGFIAQFQAAGRPGIYFRVLQEGEVSAGDMIAPLDHVAEAPSIRELYYLYFNWQDQRERIVELLERELLPPDYVKTFRKRLG